MTRVVAFDQATATTGWAFGTETSAFKDSNDVFHFGTIKAPKRDNFGERLAIIWKAIDGLIELYKPDIIGFEEPYFPMQGAGGFQKRPSPVTPATGFLPPHIRNQDDEEFEEKTRFNPETLKQLQMVKGILICKAALLGIPAIGCTPSQWRVTVLGYGRKPKGEKDDFMKRAVRQHFASRGLDLSSADESDAVGICWHTLHGRQALERAQGDLLSMGGALL